MEESSNTIQPLPFEEPLFEMEAKIAELEELSRSTGMDLNGQMNPLKQKLRELTLQTFSELSAWDRVKLARRANNIKRTREQLLKSVQEERMLLASHNSRIGTNLFFTLLALMNARQSLCRVKLRSE